MKKAGLLELNQDEAWMRKAPLLDLLLPSTIIVMVELTPPFRDGEDGHLSCLELTRGSCHSENKSYVTITLSLSVT